MSITRAEVEQIASLVRLQLSEGEVESLVGDLGSILEHVAELNAADTHGVPPTGNVSEHAAPFREDEPGADLLQLPPAEMAPAWEEGFFLVPRLAALDADSSREPEAEG